MSLRFVAVLAASSLIDFAVVALVLLPGSGPARRISAARVLAALVAVAAVALPKAFVLGALGVGFFGFLHLAYLDIYVVTPGLAVLVLWLGWRGLVRPTGAVRTLAWLVLALPPVGIYASWIEPYRLRLERAELALAPERGGVEPIHVAILADLQTTRVSDYEREAVARLMAEEPDLVLVPGDLYQGPWELLPERAPAFREVLGSLRAPGGVFLVLGNTDTVRSAEILTRGTGVRLLVDEIETVRVRDRTITIGGNRLAVGAPGARALARELEARPGSEDVRILLSHYPDALFNLSERSRVDLVVSGHTHGGQVQLPLLGPPVTLSSVPRAVGAGGLHTVGGRRVYVSRGVGMERGHAPRLRFLCPPEITILTLYSE